LLTMLSMRSVPFLPPMFNGEMSSRKLTPKLLTACGSLLWGKIECGVCEV